MASYTTENIHTVALVGHGGAGKTMLAEALLWKAGVIGAMGSLERGNTVGDFDPLEKQYGQVIVDPADIPFRLILDSFKSALATGNKTAAVSQKSLSAQENLDLSWMSSCPIWRQSWPLGRRHACWIAVTAVPSTWSRVTGTGSKRFM